MYDGQEAVGMGMQAAMSPEDSWITSYRCHCVALLRGCSVEQVFAELFGFSNGATKGKGGSMHLIDLKCNFMGSSAIVGNSIPIGVGLALSAKIKKTSQVSYVFFGDGAVEEGVFYESLNFSIVKKLPVISFHSYMFTWGNCKLFEIWCPGRRSGG